MNATSPHSAPQPAFTIFHLLTFILTLGLAAQVPIFVDSHGAWVALIAFFVALMVAYFASHYAMGASAIWLWRHSRKPFIRFEVACYLLGVVKRGSPGRQILEEQIAREFSCDDHDKPIA